MEHPGFFERAGPFSVRDLASRLGASPPRAAETLLYDVKTLADAGPADITFFNNNKYLGQLSETRAGACLIGARYADRVPPTTVPLVFDVPYDAFAAVIQIFYPESAYSLVAPNAGGAAIDPTAQIGAGVVIEPNVIIGPEAQIGDNTRICAGAVIGYRTTIGRNCYIGARATLIHSLIGDRVCIHAGASIGQDGFGFSMGPGGHKKVPQIGRVIIQDDVDIGANSTIDRGALNDTIIGQGTKIDNLVQIGHNVVIGRHCVIVALVGIAGSCELGDFVIMGGKSGLPGHLKIGTGAQIAAASHPIADVPAGARMGGTPARPYRQWAQESSILRRLAAKKK